MLCGSLNGRGVQGRTDTCIHMAVSFLCPPKTITTLLISWVCTCAKSLQSCQTLRPYGLQPTRFLCPWDSPGKNTGVGCQCPPPAVLPKPGTKPTSLTSPALADGFLTTSNICQYKFKKKIFFFILLNSHGQCQPNDIQTYVVSFTYYPFLKP